MKGYALITGAGKGIGRAISFELAKAGYSLLLVSRSETDLRFLAATLQERFKIDAHFLPLDLSKPAAAVTILEWCKDTLVPLSILVNNAGMGLWGKFESLDIEMQREMLNLNVNSVVEITYALIPLLKSQQRSFILNVSSTAAYQAVPTLSLYAATKAFLLSFSRGLRYELRDSPISVSCLCPGPTDTNFAHAAGMDALAELAKKFNMRAEEVARIGINGMFKGRAEIIPGFLNKLSAYVARHFSKRLIERITANLYRK